jgi:RHS repeat-associated protein
VGSAAQYRYGYNGKEDDNELKGNGNQIDYGFRIYDPRAARFLSEDPLTEKYPSLTPYQYASNSPISGIDEDGLEWAYYDKDNKQVDINANTTVDDKLRIVGAKWVGYDTDKDGNKVPKPGTVAMAFTFGEKGFTVGMVYDNKPFKIWTAYKDIDFGDKKSDNLFAKLHPLFQDELKAFILEADFRFGINLRITQGFRTTEEQDLLFAQSRTQAQVDAEKKLRGITRTIIANPGAPYVTGAIGGYSNHNYGLAVDMVFLVNGKENDARSRYMTLGLIMETNFSDMKWGHRFPNLDDIDHFQNMQGKTMTQLRKMPKDANGLPIFSPQSQ